MCFPRLREKAQRFDHHLPGGEIQSGDGRLQPARIVQISLNQGRLTTDTVEKVDPRSFRGLNHDLFSEALSSKPLISLECCFRHVEAIAAKLVPRRHLKSQLASVAFRLGA
jgi:hypothetical protein